MRCAWCTLCLLTGLGAAGWVLPPVVRRGETVCPGREAGCRASVAGPGMAHRRVPWDKRVSRGNPTHEGEQAGEKTFGDFGSFQSHSPQPRSGGEIPSRTGSSCPARRSRAIEAWGGIRHAMMLPPPHPNPLPQGERGSNRSRRGWRAKPHRGRRPRVLRGEAVPLRRGTTLHQAMTLPTPHPNPLPQGKRGSNRSR